MHLLLHVMRLCCVGVVCVITVLRYVLKSRVSHLLVCFAFRQSCSEARYQWALGLQTSISVPDYWYLGCTVCTVLV